MLSMILTSLVQAAAPCASGFQRYPDENGSCVPDRVVAFLACVKGLGGNQLQIETIERKGGTEVRVKASGAAKGLIAGGSGAADVLVRPSDDYKIMKQVFSPDALGECGKQVDNAFKKEPAKTGGDGLARPRQAPKQPVFVRCNHDACRHVKYEWVIECKVQPEVGGLANEIVQSSRFNGKLRNGPFSNRAWNTHGDGWYLAGFYPKDGDPGDVGCSEVTVRVPAGQVLPPDSEPKP